MGLLSALPTTTFGPPGLAWLSRNLVHFIVTTGGRLGGIRHDSAAEELGSQHDHQRLVYHPPPFP